MTTKTKPRRTLKVQQLADSLPFVKVSVAALGLRKGDFVEVSHDRSTLRLKKTAKPKKNKAKRKTTQSQRTLKEQNVSYETVSLRSAGRVTAQLVAFLALTEGVAAITRLHQTGGFTAKTFDKACDLLASQPETQSALVALRARLFG
jgi:chemotaxis response regulator CheB